MVKELAGHGFYTTDLLECLDLPRGHRTIAFNTADTNLVVALQRLAADPEEDQRSLLVRGVRNGVNSEVDVLVVSRSCPNLLPEKYPPAKDLPGADETYFAKVWHCSSPDDFLELLVLQNDPQKAERIARRMASHILGRLRRDIEVELLLLDPLDWLTVAERLIREGRNLPFHIRRYIGHPN